MEDVKLPGAAIRSVHWRQRAHAYVAALLAGFAAVGITAATGVTSLAGASAASPAPTGRYIVESAAATSAASLVQSVHGQVVSDLAPIHSVVATLTSVQASDIDAVPGSSVSPDGLVHLEGSAASSGFGTWGPQSTNGPNGLLPGQVLQVGYAFTINANHPAIEVSFVNASATLAVSCFNGSPANAITVTFPLATYSDPANDTSDWFPTGSKSSASGFEGKTTAPDLCNGGVMSLSQGATFSADVRAGTASYPVQLRWHYTYGGAGGNWGSAYSVTPDTTGGMTSPSHGPTGVFTQVTGATSVWAQDDQGAGTTVAVVDTGIDASLPDFGGRVIDGVDLSGENNPYQDSYGHGTFVAGLIASNGASSNGQYMGEAPAADLVSIKVAGVSGATTISTVVQGMSWAIANKAKDNIGVLNLSLGTIPTGPASAEPLDQAVEAAWNAGIVVVVSAGNAGPFSGTILSPGDDPLAITVGAIDDGGGTNPANFSVPSFTSVGPTLFDGFFKPDMAAPGRSVVSLAAPGSTIYNQNPSAIVGTSNFVGSGTSFSTAITSGMAASMLLSVQPSLTPNEVKGRLLFTASAGPVGDPFLDGHGVGNVQAAINVTTVELSQSGASALEAAGPTTPVNLSTTWAGSTWNSANWSGTGASASPTLGTVGSGPASSTVGGSSSLLGGAGASSNGATWNGALWNGSTWNGAIWNGALWNGATWNGALWNGSTWNGSTWNGSTWNGSTWNGSTWNGSTWNGSTWNGSTWNGSTWNGSTWNGSTWNGSTWNGTTWTGTTWNGTTWNGSVWNSDSWSSAPTS